MRKINVTLTYTYNDELIRAINEYPTMPDDEILKSARLLMMEDIRDTGIVDSVLLKAEFVDE